ncbi:MAG: STAS domain-containing protein [Pseudomonadota bacterium]
MQTNVRIVDGQACVSLNGRFDFNSHRDFRASYEPLMENQVISSITIDLAEVDYLDSSALGMLLMLRDKAGVAKKAVALTNPKGSVRQVLDIANFGKLFQIS